jgi:divalent metal cation (Fe/Co/Zn/Cd) transporter
MVGFAFFFAPAAFAHVGPTPAFAATIAASIVAITYFGYVCGGVVVLSAVLEMRSNRSAVWLAAIALIMCALGAYETNVVVPLMQHTQLQTPAYDALHRRSSSVYSIVLLLGLVGMAFSGVGRRRAGQPQ